MELNLHIYRFGLFLIALMVALPSLATGWTNDSLQSGGGLLFLAWTIFAILIIAKNPRPDPCQKSLYGILLPLLMTGIITAISAIPHFVLLGTVIHVSRGLPQHLLTLGLGLLWLPSLRILLKLVAS